VHETAHAPLAHTLPAEHAVPALPASPNPQPAVAPQLNRFVTGSTHEPPQLICVPGHETAHAPLPHTLPTEHVVPHAPQLKRSLVVLTHEPAPASPVRQVTRPGPHINAQLPAEHTCPVVHLVPHVPQLVGSLWRSLQTSPHFVVPVPHVEAHTPRLQTIPLAHAVLHAPQLVVDD
jgi:hypothetical protein